MTMYEVFISYKAYNRDLGNNDQTVANELCGLLEKAGIKCWIAPRDIEPGDNYGAAIEKAIARCKVIVLVFSRFTNLSEHIANEIDAGVEDKLDIVPFNIDGSKPNENLKYYLRRKQWIDASENYHKNIPELIEALRRKLGKPEANAETSTEQSDTSAAEHSQNEAVETQQQWPDPEEIAATIGQNESDSDSWKEKVGGAIKGALIGAALGPIGMGAGAVIGASKPNLLEFGEGDDESKEKVFTVRDVSFKMIRVKDGKMIMTGKDLEPKEVTLPCYYMCQTQVTRALWNAVMLRPFHFRWNNNGLNNDELNNDELNTPIVNVSWWDCQEFIDRLNSYTEMKFCLPTEAQWEFAARGGRKSRGYKYAGSDNVHDVAWFHLPQDHPNPVAPKKPNELGLFDMSGNVWEWCQDTDDSDFEYKNGSYSNIKYAICRGGSFKSNHESFMSPMSPDSRQKFKLEDDDKDIGFRLALLST